MFKGGSTWRPPPINPYTQGMPEDLVNREANSEFEVILRKGKLTNRLLAHYFDYYDIIYFFYFSIFVVKLELKKILWISSNENGLIVDNHKYQIRIIKSTIIFF